MDKDTRSHVFFDFDGTIISSSRVVFHCVARLVSAHLGKTVTLEEAREKYSPDHHIGFANYGIELTPELAQEFNKKWPEIALENLALYELFPGILELLDQLKAKGHELYLWTARERTSTLAILKHLNLMSYFKDLRCGDDTKVKPHPEGLFQMGSHLPRERCFVIGDSYTDILGAHEFGARSVAAFWCDEARKDEVLSFKPHFVVEKPADCLHIITGTSIPLGPEALLK
jgi:phosphoglycolate phosphatase